MKISDKVAYSSEFCRNTGQQTDPIPFARGVIKELTPFGDTFLATIEWENVENIPNKVIVKNLVKVENISYEQ